MNKIICYSLKIHIKLVFLALTKIASKISKQYYITNFFFDSKHLQTHIDPVNQIGNSASM